MKSFIDKPVNRLLDYIQKMGKINFIFSIIVFVAVVVKFIVFYNLVDVTDNLITVIAISCMLTWLVLGSFKNRWTAVTIYFMISFLMFCDVTYFSFFNQYLSLSMLGAAEVIGAIGESIKQVLRPVNFVMFMDAAILYLMLFYKRFVLEEKIVRIRTRKGYIKPLTALIVIVLIVTNFPQNDFLTSVSNQEIYSFRVKDTLANTIGFGADNNFIFANGYAQQKNGPIFGAGAGKNLIVIQLESFQNFVLGLEYNGQEVTPNLNLSLIHISEPTRLGMISYAVFCLKK